MKKYARNFRLWLLSMAALWVIENDRLKNRTVLAIGELADALNEEP